MLPSAVRQASAVIPKDAAARGAARAGIAAEVAAAPATVAPTAATATETAPASLVPRACRRRGCLHAQQRFDGGTSEVGNARTD